MSGVVQCRNPSLDGCSPRSDHMWKALERIKGRDLPPKMSKQLMHLENPSLASWGFSGNLILFQWGATFTWTSAQLSWGAVVRAAKHSGVTAASPMRPAPQHCRNPLGSKAVVCSMGQSTHCGTWHDATTLQRDCGWEESRGGVCQAGSALAFGLGRGSNGEKLACEALRTGTLYVLRGALRDAWLWVLHPSAHSSRSVRQGLLIPTPPTPPASSVVLLLFLNPFLPLPCTRVCAALPLWRLQINQPGLGHWQYHCCNSQQIQGRFHMAVGSPLPGSQPAQPGCLAAPPRCKMAPQSPEPALRD